MATPVKCVDLKSRLSEANLATVQSCFPPLAGSMGGADPVNAVDEDGSVERWKKPRLADWEVPRRDPSEPRPQHPVMLAQRRKVQRQWRARRRAAREVASPFAEREGAELAATHDAHRANRCGVTGAARVSSRPTEGNAPSLRSVSAPFPA
jgi:hypothetical protein